MLLSSQKGYYQGPLRTASSTFRELASHEQSLKTKQSTRPMLYLPRTLLLKAKQLRVRHLCNSTCMCLTLSMAWTSWVIVHWMSYYQMQA